VDSTTITCSNPDCDVAATQRCVEGLELSLCPHYGKPPPDRSTSADSAEETALTAPKAILLRAANTLTIAQAADVRRARQSRVVAVVGSQEAGKTSLIVSVYDLFQRGPVGPIRFGRSLTMHAFEETCHDARDASRRGLPHTERTQRGEVRFYHLEIAPPNETQPITLLLADRAGEEYDNATDNHDRVEFPEIRSADTITVLVDGDRLQDSKTRHLVLSKIPLLVRVLVESGMTNDRQHLALVLTKGDAVQHSPNAGRALGDFETLAANVAGRFDSCFATIATYRVAASPKTADIQRGTGVAEVLTFWLQPQRAPITTLPSTISTDRMMAELRAAGTAL
jgi:hypothetical protein